MEIEKYQIKFEYIKGIKNTLADTMSRLIVINPDTCQDPEPEGQEYWYFIFEELPNISVTKILISKSNITLNEMMLPSSHSDIDLNITHERLCQVQQEDPFFKRIIDLLHC